MAQDIVITEALDAARIGGELIAEYHLHLLDARILYLFTTQQRKKCDRVRLASAHKFSALHRYLSSVHIRETPEASVDYGADFLILIDREEWKRLSPRQQRALIDHELTHCARVEKITDTGVEGHWAIRGHDVEEFSDIIQRHGLWRQDLKNMAKAIEQGTLPLEDRAVEYLPNA